jgi:hypothetical protein
LKDGDSTVQPSKRPVLAFHTVFQSLFTFLVDGESVRSPRAGSRGMKGSGGRGRVNITRFSFRESAWLSRRISFPIMRSGWLSQQRAET